MTAVHEAEAVPIHVVGGTPRSRRASPGRLLDTAVVIGLLIVAATVLLRATETVPFHGDESEWINNGRYFTFVFLDHDVTSNVWRASWVNRDQPPVGRYIIGAIVWASGTAPDHVNKTYAWERNYEANLREGRVPGPEILVPVRRTMAVLGAVSIVLLYPAGRLIGGSVLGGTITGIVAALAATASPLLQTYFAQARTEALLALFSMIGLLAVLHTARRFNQTGRLPTVAWAVGPILGVALATKLTAAVGLVSVCAFGGVAGLLRLRANRLEGVWLLGWAFSVGALATVVWVLVNPFLWPDPVGRTWSMLEQQQSIMVEQGEQFGNPVTLSLPGRLLLMVERTFVENSTPPFDAGRPPGSDPLMRRTFTELPTVFGVSLELALAVVGLAAMLRRIVRNWRVGAFGGPETALTWWLAGYLLGIGANLSLDWPRYYVPTAYFGALLIGLGAQALIGAAMFRWQTGAGVTAQSATARPEAAH
ncbi:MAG: hypothetical protein AB7K36_12725 [Chloroflexota bacterium]